MTTPHLFDTIIPELEERVRAAWDAPGSAADVAPVHVQVEGAGRVQAHPHHAARSQASQGVSQ